GRYDGHHSDNKENTPTSTKDNDDAEWQPESQQEDPSENTYDVEETQQTNDIVRIYLKKMGKVALLTRNQEIILAKRIDAGIAKTVGAIFESPLTIAAIREWYDALNNDTMQLRHIVDLEATYDADKSNDAEADIEKQFIIDDAKNENESEYEFED